MTGFLMLVLGVTAWVMFEPSRHLGQRLRRAVAPKTSIPHATRMPWRRHQVATLPLTVLVQQLAALLRGGRSPSRLWTELWMVHGETDGSTGFGGSGSPSVRGKGSGLRAASSGSLHVLATARAASMTGASVAEAIRTSAGQVFVGGNPAERRIWGELASCLDVAEASGCPLADVLTRFASQLEAEDDADDARQIALAGPKATVRLLTWLPVFGLGLGMMLGVNPLGILFGNVAGMVALVAGIALTTMGRIWASRLVRASVGVD